MCGIFGMFGDSSPGERDAAAREAIRLLRHRGPDDAGSLDVGDGVLVSRRLAIVDLAPTGSVSGVLSLEFPGDGTRPASGAHGKFDARMCHGG